MFTAITTSSHSMKFLMFLCVFGLLKYERLESIETRVCMDKSKK